MKKSIFLLALATLASSFVINNDHLANKSLSDKDEPYVEKIKQSTLVVVLLDENEDYLAKLTKKGKEDIAATYSKSIKTYNDNIRAMVPKYLNISSNIVFKTPSEIGDMSTDERNSYTYLVYNRSDVMEDGNNVCNFDYDGNMQKMVERYENYIQFECLGPNYTGAPDYRKLDIYAPGTKKHEYSGGFQQNLTEIVPTQGDLKICLLQLQQQFETLVKMENITKDERKAMLYKAENNMGANYDTIKQKTLLICKLNIDKTLNVDFIKKYYPYSYKVVSKDDFDKAILDNDAKYCALVVLPFIKIKAPYGPVSVTSVKYIHYVINLSDEATLYTSGGTHTHVMVGTMGMGGYETVTEKNLEELAGFLQNPGK